MKLAIYKAVHTVEIYGRWEGAQNHSRQYSQSSHCFVSGRTACMSFFISQHGCHDHVVLSMGVGEGKAWEIITVFNPTVIILIFTSTPMQRQEVAILRSGCLLYASSNFTIFGNRSAYALSYSWPPLCSIM